MFAVSLAYSYLPFSGTAVEMDSLEFRGCFCGGLCGVACVLKVCCEAEIGSAVVKGVAIDMIDEEMVGGVDDETVHHQGRAMSFAGAAGEAGGVECTAIRLGIPLAANETVVVGRVNDCVLALREGDTSEGAAIAKPAIQQDRQRD